MFKIKDLGVVKIIKMSLVEDALGSEYSTSRLANLLPEWRHPPIPSPHLTVRPVANAPLLGTLVKCLNTVRNRFLFLNN